MRFNLKKIALRILALLVLIYVIIILRNWLQDSNLLPANEYPPEKPLIPIDTQGVPPKNLMLPKTPIERKDRNLNIHNVESVEQQPAQSGGLNKSKHNSPSQLSLPFGLQPTDLYTNQLFTTLGKFFFDSPSTFQGRLPILPSEGDFNEDRITNEMRFMPEALVALRKAGKKLQMKRIVFMSGGGVEPGQTRLNNDNCPVKECSYELHSSGAADADVLMWQGSVFMPGHRRPRNQLWVLYLLESPYHTPDFGAFRGQFNITATYRHDSTIVAPYYRWQLYNPSVRYSAPLFYNVLDWRTCFLKLYLLMY